MHKFNSVQEAYHQFCAATRALGFSLKPTLDGVGIAISFEGEPVCVFDWQQSGNEASFVMHSQAWPDRILFNASYSKPESGFLAEAVDGAQMMLRAWLVIQNRMPPTGFPTDYAMQNWLAASAAVRLPRERKGSSDRYAEGCFRLMHRPKLGLQVECEAGKEIVVLARALTQNFDRAKALVLTQRAMSARGGSDSALEWIARSARSAFRSRLNDNCFAWDAGSLARVLVGLAGKRDDLAWREPTCHRLEQDPQIDIDQGNAPTHCM